MVLNLMKSSVFKKFGRYVYEFESFGFRIPKNGTTLKRVIEIERHVWSKGSLDDLPDEAICVHPSDAAELNFHQGTALITKALRCSW